MVDKTFVREKGGTRTQNYDGIKYRRWESEKGKKAAEEEGKEFTPFIEDQFIVSKKAFEKLNLTQYALTQFKTDKDVLLVVLKEVEGAKPEAKFLKQSYSKEGVAQNKSSFFSNVFLAEDLAAKGLIDKDKLGSQFLGLEDVTAEITDIPSHVVAIYKVVVDTTGSDDEEEEEVATETSTPTSSDY